MSPTEKTVFYDRNIHQMFKDALLNQFNYNDLQDCTQVNNTKMIQVWQLVGDSLNVLDCSPSFCFRICKIEER